MTTISQGLILVVFGDKTKGKTHHKWYRVTRRKFTSVESYFTKLPNFYYAKLYVYHRLGKKKGHIGDQIAYIYLKNNIVTSRIL